jgi:hypothetical protein
MTNFSIKLTHRFEPLTYRLIRRRPEGLRLLASRTFIVRKCMLFFTRRSRSPLLSSTSTSNTLVFCVSDSFCCLIVTFGSHGGPPTENRRHNNTFLPCLGRAMIPRSSLTTFPVRMELYWDVNINNILSSGGHGGPGGPGHGTGGMGGSGGTGEGPTVNIDNSTNKMYVSEVSRVPSPLSSFSTTTV